MLVLVCYDVNTETKSGRRRLRRGLQCRHGKAVLGGEVGGDKARVDQIHAQALAAQIGVKNLRQIVAHYWGEPVSAAPDSVSWICRWRAAFCSWRRLAKKSDSMLDASAASTPPVTSV